MQIGSKTCESCGNTFQVFKQVIAGREILFDYCWPCKKAEEEKQIVQGIHKQNEQARKEKLQRIFDNHSFINGNLKNCTLENFKTDTETQERAFRAAKRYLEIFSSDTPKNFVLYGSYGMGKSHIAVGILKELMKEGYSGIFVSVPKLLQAFRNTYNKDSEVSEGQLLEALETVDCLVLDDIGAENSTDWATDKLFNIVDSRQGKSTIFTTNLSTEIPEDQDDPKRPKGLEMKIGARNFSRVMMNAGVLQMVGKDFRRD